MPVSVTSAKKKKLYIDFEDIPKIRERIANGQYKVSDILVFHNDCQNKDTPYKVIGVNAESKLLPPHITVMATTADRDKYFDVAGSNHWATSSLRKFLNEDYPKEVPVLNELAHKVLKKNNDGQRDTLDKFWLLSLSELDDELSPYKEFVSDIHNLQSNYDYRWLRSAYRGTAYFTWYVNSSGHVSGYGASAANRFSPVCVLW